MHRHADRSKMVTIITRSLSYLSTFFQSKLRRMTTGGAGGVASDGGVVPDRQGEVSTQHSPSAKSETPRIREVRQCSQAYKQTQNKCYVAWFALTALTLYCSHINQTYDLPLLQQITLTLCVRTSGHYQACILNLISCFVSKMSEQEIYSQPLIRNSSILGTR